MKGKKLLRRKKYVRKIAKKTVSTLREFGMITLCAVVAVTISISSKILDVSKDEEVFAASDIAGVDISGSEREYPSGIGAVLDSMSENPYAARTVERIGTSCEEVVVGQRFQIVEEESLGLNFSDSMTSTINRINQKVTSLVENGTIMSDEDYQVLLKIVEAEAGTEDVKGRVLVANVIMNRVKSEDFPDNITDVVFQYGNGVPQFSPVHDGRIYTVTVTDKTREAVKQAMEGVDYSEGALFFIMKSAAEEEGVTWFEEELKFLFKHGLHEFYGYKDKANLKEEKKAAVSEEVIQMVKN